MEEVINIYNYKNKSVKAIMHLPGDHHSLPVNSFASLYIDDEDNIWAGSIRGGTDRNQTRFYDYLSGCSSRGVLWIKFPVGYFHV